MLIGFEELLIHTCTLQKRTVSAGSPANYGHGTTTWANSTTGIACRLDTQTAKASLGGGELVTPYHENVPVIEYVLFMVWRSELATFGAAAEYRVTNVQRATDSTVIDAGPFDIKQVIDAGGLGETHELRLVRTPVTT